MHAMYLELDCTMLALNVLRQLPTRKATPMARPDAAASQSQLTVKSTSV